MRRSNAENSATFTAKQGFFDRTLALHTDRLGVSCRAQTKALIEHRFSLAQRTVPEKLPSVRKHFRDNAALPIHTTKGSLTSNERSKSDQTTITENEDEQSQG